MKPSLAVALSTFSMGLLLSVSARADDPSTPPSPPPPAAQTSPADGTETAPPRHHRMRGGYVLSDLTEKLGLTADQQKKVGAVIDAGASQAKQVRSDDSLSKEDRHQKMMDIMKSTHDQIRALLTPDQQTQFDALHAHGNRTKAPDSN